MIHYQRYFQTESLGPVPRSFHCFSGQNYSHLQHKLEGGGVAAGCQLLGRDSDAHLLAPPLAGHWRQPPPHPSPTRPNTALKQGYGPKTASPSLSAFAVRPEFCIGLVPSLGWLLHVLFSSPHPSTCQGSCVFILLPT